MSASTLMKLTLGLYMVCNYTQLLCSGNLVGQLDREQRGQSQEGHWQRSRQQEKDKSSCA